MLGEDIVKNNLTASVVLWRAHPNAQAQLLDGRSRLDGLEIVIGKPAKSRTTAGDRGPA